MVIIIFAKRFKNSLSQCRFAFRLALMIIFLVATSSCQIGDNFAKIITQKNEYILKKWQYVWPDNYNQAKDLLVAGQERALLDLRNLSEKKSLSTVWHSLNQPYNPPDRGERSLILFRTYLPQMSNDSKPALLINNVDQIMHLFVDGQLRYQVGDMSSQGFIPSLIQWHIIDLEISDLGKPIYCLVFSNHVNIGLFGSVILAEQTSLYINIFYKNIDSLIISAMLIMMSIFVFIYYLYSDGFPSSLYLAIFIANAGLFFLIRNPISQFMGIDQYIATKIEMFLLYLLPSGLLLYLQNRDYIFYGKWLFIAHIIYGAMALLFDLVAWQPIMSFQAPFLYVIFFEIIISFYFILTSNTSYKKQKNITLVGICILLIFCVVDIVGVLGIIYWQNNMSHYGMLIFIVLLSWLEIEKYQGLNNILLEKSQSWQQRSMQLANMTETLTLALRGRARLEMLEQELDQARRIQKSLMPKQFAKFEHLQIAAKYIPMLSIGGDYYDFFGDDDCIGLFIADVAGHGIGASLIAAMVKSAMTQNSDKYQQPAELLKAVNKICLQSPDSIFVTGSYLAIDAKNKRAEYVRAGHIPLIHLRKKKSLVEEYKPKGYPMGWMSNLTLETETIFLESGDRLCMITDGIVEACSPNGEMLGFERLYRIFIDCRDMPLLKFVDHLKLSIDQWVWPQTELPEIKQSHEDDITFIVVDIT